VTVTICQTSGSTSGPRCGSCTDDSHEDRETGVNTSQPEPAAPSADLVPADDAARTGPTDLIVSAKCAAQVRALTQR